MTSNDQNMENSIPPVSVPTSNSDKGHKDKLKPGGERCDDAGFVRTSPDDEGANGLEKPDLTCDKGNMERNGDKGDVDQDDGKDASMQVDMKTIKRRRVHRANLYTWVEGGIKYHIEINSPLGETYRNLPTRAEQRAFAMEHGTQRPAAPETRLWAAR